MTFSKDFKRSCDDTNSCVDETSSFFNMRFNRTACAAGVRAECIRKVWLKNDYSHAHMERTTSSVDVRPPMDSLTLEGIQAFKRVLGETLAHSSIDFCPLLSLLAETSLHFLTEVETLSICIEFTRRTLSVSVRPFCFGNWAEFQRVVSMIYIGVRKFVNTGKLKIDLSIWLARHLAEGGSKIFGFGLLVRIFGSFLFNGVKVLGRYLIASLVLAGKALYDAKTFDELDLIISKIAENPIKLGRLAFALNWSMKGKHGCMHSDMEIVTLNQNEFAHLFFTKVDDLWTTNKDQSSIINITNLLSAISTLDRMLALREWVCVSLTTLSRRLDVEELIFIVKTNVGTRVLVLSEFTRIGLDEDKVLFTFTKDHKLTVSKHGIFIGSILSFDDSLLYVNGSLFDSIEPVTLLELEVLEN